MSAHLARAWFLTGAVGTLACVSPALAADMPVKAALVVAAVYNWTGFYIGGHVGYGQGMKDWRNSSFDYDVKGFLGGGQIGVNQQIGNLVIGLEGDASWARIRGDQTLSLGGPLIAFTQSTTGNTTIDRLVTFTGRLGVAQDRWLVYVKGGAAWVNEKHKFSVISVAGAVTPTGNAAGAEDRFGIALGVGSEFALGGNWSFKSEYNYIHLNPNTVQMVGTLTNAGVTTPFTINADIRQTLHLAKFGVNYRYGTPAPAIAPVRPAAGYDWTGAWVGAQVGYGLGHKRWPDSDPLGGFDVKGWLGGVTTGANVQVGQFVAGVESEWLWTGIDGGRRDVTTAGLITTTADIATKVDWLSLNSLRLGFVVTDRWMVYGKGGFALAQEKHHLGVGVSQPGFGSTSSDFNGRALHTGYLGGVGVEYAFLGNWSAKLEYNYVGFRWQDVMTTGTQTLNIPPTVGTIANLRRLTEIRQDLHLIKFGINYHFTSIADVVRARF